MKKWIVAFGIALFTGATIVVIDGAVKRKKKYAEVKINDDGMPVSDESEQEEVLDEETQQKIAEKVEKLVNWIIDHEKHFKAFGLVGGALITIFRLRKHMKENEFQKEVLVLLNDLQEHERKRGWTDCEKDLSKWLQTIVPGESGILMDLFDNNRRYEVSVYD